MINRIVLVGRMTRDPELRRTQSGAAVTNFTLAVNRNFKTEGQPDADFINCVIWNKSAENVERYCSKGSLVGVEGRLQSRQYDAQDGTKRTVIEVVCDSVQFLETKVRESNPQQFMESIPVDQDPFRTPGHEFDLGIQNFDKEYEIMDDDIQF